VSRLPVCGTGGNQTLSSGRPCRAASSSSTRTTDHPIHRIDALLPWNWDGPPTTVSTAA
jgi:hypothetical protein